MGNFKATRIKIEGITFDLDNPILDPVYYQTTRRMPRNQAVERLVKDHHVKPDREIRRARVKEDAIIKAIKAVGEIFVPDTSRKKGG